MPNMRQRMSKEEFPESPSIRHILCSSAFAALRIRRVPFGKPQISVDHYTAWATMLAYGLERRAGPDAGDRALGVFRPRRRGADHAARRPGDARLDRRSRRQWPHE